MYKKIIKKILLIFYVKKTLYFGYWYYKFLRCYNFYVKSLKTSGLMTSILVNILIFYLNCSLISSFFFYVSLIINIFSFIRLWDNHKEWESSLLVHIYKHIIPTVTSHRNSHVSIAMKREKRDLNFILKIKIKYSLT